MKLRPFELTLIVIFVVMALGALLLLSNWKPGGSNDGPVIGNVTIWGTLPKEGMDTVFSQLDTEERPYGGVEYVEVRDESFDSELINAIADGNGPDLILLSHERLVQLRTKLKPMSYEAIPQRDITSTYVDGVQVFALSDGLYSSPLMVDPLMLYWNRTLLTNSNFLQAPGTWESLVNEYFPALVLRNPDRTIVRSVVALGEYNNVRNASGILSMLLLQAGSKGVTNTDARRYEIQLNDSIDAQSRPLEVAVDFYTRFSRPSNSLYNWNRSFSGDRDRFLSGDLAFYFGYGSEAKGLEGQNPNLAFDIAEVPQGATATIRRTYGRFYGLSALQSSDNLVGASLVMRDLSSVQVAPKLAQLYDMAPVHRTAVSAGSNDTYGRLTYKSAGIAYGWLSPRPSAVDSVFGNLTTDVNENRKDTGGAVGDALGRLQLEYNN